MDRFTSSLCFYCTVLTTVAAVMSGCTHDDKPTVSSPVKVTVQPVSLSQSGNGHTFSGTVESSKSSTVSFPVAGTITDMAVDEGDRVAKGQLLARVRSANYVNASNIADAELAEARDAYARLKKLHDADALPEIKWVEIQNKLKQAENAVELSRRTVSDASLHSPVDGVISRKIADVGQTVVPAEPVFEIVTVSDLMIAVSVPESEIGKVAEGQNAKVSFNTLGIDSINGRVSRKAVVADPLTRAYTVKISIPTVNGRILPGMIGNVVFADSLHSSEPASVLLPSQAVLLGADNRTFVWVVDKGKAVRRFVDADELSSGGILVTRGLVAGDSVIVAGMQKVGTGTPVSAELSDTNK